MFSRRGAHLSSVIQPNSFVRFPKQISVDLSSACVCMFLDAYTPISRNIKTTDRSIKLSLF